MAKPQRKRKYRRKYQTEYQARLYYRWKAAVYGLLGKECKQCGFSDERALQIDHVHGGGTKDRKRFSKGKNFIAYYRYIVENPDGYQILCANCNWIKRAENSEHLARGLAS